MISRAIRPLRPIFWGGQICLLALTVSHVSPTGANGRGYRFDFINDFVGSVMIAVGVFHLDKFIVNHRYRSAMLFVKTFTIFAILHAIREHFIFPISPPVQIMEHVYRFVEAGAIMTFCIAMQWLSNAARLHISGASWRTTIILFATLYAAPMGVAHFVGLFAITIGKPIHIDLGAAGLFLLLIFLIPSVHLFISISRMRREAGRTLV